MALTDAQAKIIAENKRKKEEEEARKKAALKAAEKALASTKTGSAVQSPLKKMTATGFRPGALASQEVKKATKKAAEPARQKAIQDAQDALANARDRRSRAAANQRLRDAKYPLTGRDAELSTVDKLEIQRAKERWERVDRLEKEHGASDYTRRLKREAHNQAESIRVRHGYTGGTDGSEHAAPILNAEDRKGSKVYQENLALLDLYKSMARDNGNFALYNWAQEQEDILRGVKSEGGNESAISWVDKIPQDREYLEGEVAKAQEALKAAQDALRSFHSNGSLHAQDSLRRLQENVEKKKAALEEAERRVERVDYVEGFQDLTYQEDGSKWNDFWAQFHANRKLGRITQDTSKAYNEFLENPTAANQAYAWALAELEREFRERNAGVLDEEGQVLPWLSESVAGYLPQLRDQTKASVAGAAAGAAAGAGVGFAAGGIGAVPGVVWGARAGAVAGSGKYSYDTMRGAAYRQLVESGVDEATAREAAGDEAVISALIEMADTGIDIFTLGIGSALKMAGKGAAETATKTAGKKLATALGKYGLNIGSEMAQEASQQAVSYANLNRDDTGLWDLAKETWGVGVDAVTGKNQEARDQMWEAAKEGGKIAAMMGGAGMVTSAAVNKGLEKGITALGQRASDKELGKRVKEQGREAVQELVEEGYASEETAYLASPVATKLQRGETPSDQEVGRLARAVRGEEETVQAEPVQESEDILEEAARETVQEAQEEVRAATFAAPREVVAEEQSVAPVAAESVLEGEEDILVQVASEMTAPKTREVSKVVKGLGYGQHGTQTFERIVENSDMTVDEAKMRFQSAYEAGLTNTPRERVSLLGGIQEQAYNAGRQDYILTLGKAQDGSQYATVHGKNSGFVMNDAARDVDQKLVDDLHKVSKTLGIKTMFVESISQGSDGAVAGGYMTSDGVLVIAKNAVNPYAEVAKHEITHRLQKLAPKEYLAFRNLAVEYESRDRGYGNTTMVEEIQDFYAENDVHLTTEEAMDEIAANFAERLFTDEKARKAMAEQAAQGKQTRTVMEKFWQAVREFIQKVKKAFKGDKAKMDQAAQEQYGATIAELEEAERLWKEAYRAAAENVKKAESQQASDTRVAASLKMGDEAAVFEENGKQYSIKSLNHDIAEGKMFSDLVEAGVFTKAQATRLKTNLTKLIEYMVPNANILDMNETYGKGNRPFKAFKPNSDPLYVISLDFSTLCRKRLMTQYVIEQLQLRENRPMTAEEQLAIRSMLLDYREQEKALQVACAMCYVEAARLKAPKQMETYFKNTESVLTKYFAMKNKEFNDSVKKAQEDFKVSHGYKAKDPKSAMTGAHRKAFDQMSDRMRKGYTPTAEEKAIIETAKGLPKSTYLTAANLTELSVKHPEIYDAYTTYIRNATRSKSLESDIPYYYGDSQEAVTDGFIEKVNAENGMRFDSWSDFQMKHMLDMITAVIDLSVRGSKMHGYTKFPEMVRIFGKTGMQFNLSGVTEGNGFDENGELVFSSIEGMSKEDAIQLRKDFPETAGFQCIGVSDEHIRALLRADYIDYVIPYHISGLNKTMRRMAGIYKWEDFSLVQHAKKDPKAKKPEGAENWQVEPVWSEFYVSEGENGLDIMKKTAKNYIDMCHERGLIPKFDDFTDEDGYWKLLVDRKMINQKTGKIIEQQPVKPVFDFKLIKEEIDREVKGYDPSLEQRALDYVVENFDAVNTRIQELKKQGTLINQKQKTRKQMKTLGNEILQAYAQGTKERPAPARESLEGVQFSLKGKDSQGNQLSPGQVEYFKDSKVRDEDGNLKVMYHGTKKYGFNIFDYGRQKFGLFGSGFYFTDNVSVAEGYAMDSHGNAKDGSGIYEVFLNITNPIDMDAYADKEAWVSAIAKTFDESPEDINGRLEGLIASMSERMNGAKESVKNSDMFYIMREVMYDQELEKYEAAEMAEDCVRSMGYDGITHIGGGRYFTGDKTRHRVFIAFEQEQIKNVDNANPTDHPDIRFSMKAQKDLMKENAKLREVNQGLREQFKTTKFAKVDKKALDRFTKDLLKDYASGADINEIRQMLDDLYTTMHNAEDKNSITWSTACSKAFDAAVSILENASVLDDEMWKAYSDLRKYLRTTAISISKEYDGDLGGYESIEEFRKANFGRLKITKDGTPVDVIYQELSARWPDFFNEEDVSNPADQLLAIAEVLDQLQPTEINPYSHNMREAATWLSNDIMERFFNLPQAKPTFADKAQEKLTRQVIKDREKLEKLREQKNERIAQIIQENREKLKTVQAKEKVKRQEAVQKVKEHYKAKEAKGSESRKARELRAKIMRHAKDLNDKLLKPTDKHHVPEDLRKPVAAMLDAINQESQFVIDEATGKRKKGGEGLPTGRTEAFRKLRDVYATIASQADGGLVVDDALLGNQAENFKGYFDQLLDMGDIPLDSMTLSQLETVWKVVRGVEHAITTFNKILSHAKFQRTSEWAQALVDDTETRKRRKGRVTEKMRLDLENPYTFFSHLGEAGKEIFRMLRNAQDHQQMMVEEVAEAVRKIVTPDAVKKLEKETAAFDTDRGGRLTLTKAHMMEFYLLAKQEDGMRHLTNGGLFQPEIKSKKIKRGTEATLLTGADVARIVGSLTQDEVKIAEELQKLTATLLADWGNEASMKAYGYKKFENPDYWTISSAREGVHSNAENSSTNVRSIKNIGLAKNRNPNANNPLDIGGIFGTFERHAGNMIDYAAWLCPMEDANRLYNFRFVDEDGNVTGKYVKGLLDGVIGEKAQQYWQNLMNDIQNGLHDGEDTNVGPVISRVIGGARGASVGANLRVIVQQPTAILRAAAVLNPADMAAGLAVGGGWKKAVEHSAIAKRKALGGFDISSPAQMGEILFGKKGGLDKFNKTMMWGAGKADAVTWGRIWNACEAAAKRQHKDLEKGSDAFYKEVSRLFSEVVDQSQVVDGVLQRSQIMRSSGELKKAATAFMGEPIMTLNMLVRAYDNMANETNPKKRGAAIRAFGRTAMVLVVTNAVNALAQSIVDAWRDDEDEKKYLERLKGQFLGVTGDEEGAWDKVKAATLEGNLGASLNPVMYIPFVKDVLSLIEGYDVERPDAAVVTDVIQAVMTLIESLGGDGKRTVGYAMGDVFKQVGKIFGVSAPNIARDVWGIVRSAAIETGNIGFQYRMEKAIYKLGGSANKSRYMDLLYRAYKDDQETYKTMYTEMVDAGYSEEDIRSAMENRMKKDQGVTSVDDLDSRYIPPTKQGEYNSLMKGLENSSVWGEATEEQREKVEARVYDMAMGKADESVADKVAAGAEYNVDEADYLLYQLALAVADQPSESGKYGGYTTSERAEAVISTGLTDKEMAYLWYSGQTGSESQWSSEVFDALDKGIDIETYLEFKAFESVTTAKDDSGKTVTGLKKERIMNWLNENSVGMDAWDYFMYDVMGYKK